MDSCCPGQLDASRSLVSASNTALLTFKWWLVRLSTQTQIHGFLNAFPSLDIDSLQLSKCSSSPLEYFMEAGWITSCISTNPQTLTQTSRVQVCRVLENAVNMCRGSRLRGKRGCCCWPDPSGERRSPRAPAAKQCDVILRPPRPGRRQSLARWPPGSSEERPV